MFITIAVLANSFGNMLLYEAMAGLPGFHQVPFGDYVFRLAKNPYMLPGAALTALYAFVQIWLFSWADLSFVVPCTAASYIVSTLLADFVLGESVHLARWIGVVMICVGVALVARTPVATKPRGERSEA